MRSLHGRLAAERGNRGCNLAVGGCKRASWGLWAAVGRSRPPGDGRACKGWPIILSYEDEALASFGNGR